ncbi:MAG TPA: ATP-binding cassette domain-containing protein [Polyangiales bacterium]
MRTELEQTSGGGSAQADTALPHLRVVDLHKSYGAHKVLQGVDFDVQRGMTNVIVGRSGSGKTVLLRQLLLLERPDSGRIELDGVDLCKLSDAALLPLRKKFGVVFQDSALLDSLSVFDNVAFPLREHSTLPRAEIGVRVNAILRTLDVLDARDALPGALSGGMRRRVALARALVGAPEIVVYDEPTRGLDPLRSRAVDQLIEDTRKRLGLTAILISHDLTTVRDIAHRVNLLEEGRVVFSGSRDEFFSTDHALVRAFLRASGVKRPQG